MKSRDWALVLLCLMVIALLGKPVYSPPSNGSPGFLGRLLQLAGLWKFVVGDAPPGATRAQSLAEGHHETEAASPSDCDSVVGPYELPSQNTAQVRYMDAHGNPVLDHSRGW